MESVFAHHILNISGDRNLIEKNNNNNNVQLPQKYILIRGVII